MRIALCFPGQGSQAAGMASGLTETALGAELLEVARDEGLDLRAALAGGDDELRPTDVAQPALVFTELVLAAELPEALPVVGVAGHSVGELTALSVAGVYPPATALRLAIHRGRAMAAMTEGTMAAVLGLDADAVAEACAATSGAGDVVVVANLNAPGQVVVSGTASGVQAAGERLRAAGARRVVPLNVSGAFHSPLMRPAAREFAALIDATPTEELRIPVACNVDGAVIEHGVDAPDRLRRQLESPVRWVDCVAALGRLGAETLVEVGPGSVLSALARRIDPALGTASVTTLEAARALGRTLAPA